MKKAWYYIKMVAVWISKRLKSTYAAEWTVIALGAWLIYTQAKTIGIIVTLLGIVYLINEIYENSKKDEMVK